MINLDKLKELKACESGLVNFARYNRTFSGSVADALLLDRVPYSDKKWLISLAVPRKTYRSWILEVVKIIRDSYSPIFLDQIELRGCINLVDNFTYSPFPEQAEAAFKAAESIVDYVSRGNLAQQDMNLFLITSYL